LGKRLYKTSPVINASLAFTCNIKNKDSWAQFHQRSTCSFMGADPKSAKKTVKLQVFFALSGSARTKAARETLMKLTPDV